ncbi:hypothetical protein D6833_00880 [Candidatus Parcubacteria bacterium]|nr:MAG: hypothetical protein D6833_00880 [Candidatus Parcubacteria bacterium]
MSWKKGDYEQLERAEEIARQSSKKPWWQQAGEWVQQKIVQPVQQAVPKIQAHLDNGLRWIDQHQPQTALAVGVGVGLAAAAIVLTGGLAAPVAMGLAIGVAGLTVGGGTVGLNAYFGRPLGTNVLRNVGYAVGAAALTSGVFIGAGLLVQHGVVQQGLYAVGNMATRLCVTYPVGCARVGDALELWDKVEDIGLQAKLAIQRARGDPRVAETALELQLEQLDNTPGNTTFREIQESLLTLVGRHGDDVTRLVERFGMEGAELLAKHEDEAFETLSHSVPASVSLEDVVPEKYLDEIRDAFDGEPIPITLQEDLTVTRYWSDPERKVGRWVTLRPDLHPEKARSILALPNDNLATNSSRFVIPKGSTVFVGTAAPQVDKSWAGHYATGGGLQIYIPDPAVLLPEIAH